MRDGHDTPSAALLLIPHHDLTIAPSARYSQRGQLFLETRHIQGPGRLSSAGSWTSVKRVLNSVKQVLKLSKLGPKLSKLGPKYSKTGPKYSKTEVPQYQYRPNRCQTVPKTVPNSARTPLYSRPLGSPTVFQERSYVHAPVVP